MNIRLLGAFAILAMSGPAFCGAPHVHFEGEVQRDNGKPATFALSVAVGQTSRLALLNQTVVEFATVGAAHSDSTIIRLYDTAGKLLHSDTIPGKDLARVSFRYVVCGDKVTFVSPASRGPVSCLKT